jgi:putative two-component system response regulator
MYQAEEDIRGSSVLIVDDTPENLRLLAAIMKRGSLVPRPIMNGRLAIEAAVMDPPDLVLLDIRLPDMSGFDVCRWFKQDERLHHIPIIFISGLQGTDDKVDAFHAGGIDYVSKPFQAEEILLRVITHLRLRLVQTKLASQNAQLEQQVAKQMMAISDAQMATIFALAKLAEARDDDTGKHIERIRTYSKMLAEQMRELNLHTTRLTSRYVDNLYQTAALHDIGKVGIPDSILLKPEKLTPEEFTEMKKHCALGATTLATVLKRHPDNQFLQMGVDVARSHHERWDGEGYPDKLKNTQIPLSARIVALADFYDALTSNRCYRKAVSHSETCSLIQKGIGTHFDPEIVNAFNSIEGEFSRVRQEQI